MMRIPSITGVLRCILFSEAEGKPARKLLWMDEIVQHLVLLWTSLVAWFISVFTLIFATRSLAGAFYTQCYLKWCHDGVWMFDSILSQTDEGCFDSCTKTCHCNGGAASCDSTTGVCSGARGCLSEWTGTSCQTGNTNNEKFIILGVPQKVECSVFVTFKFENIAYFDFIR